MTYFITYTDADGKSQAVRFFSDSLMWTWLQDWRNKFGGLPKDLAVYKAECVFDGS